MSFEKVKFIAFDLDGTLLDSVPDLAVAVDQTVQALGYDPIEEIQVRDWVGNGADVLIARGLSRSIHVDENLSSDEIKKAREMFDRFYSESGHKLSHLYPTVIDTLRQLQKRGYTMSLVTNKPSKFVPEIMEQHGITSFFTDIIGGEDFPKRKPDPIALNWLLEKHGFSADQMLMVGDSKNDILAAKNAGCFSFGLTYGYNHGESISDSNPDVVADQLSDLLEILPELA
ncbi:phosphoglycolate phosphatase [Vibrio algarum]|uniref:Phosphoglycolate phosphatase n=1 Tax=Vibrio algarum TaxID=3020714 RepID=A0ABT4YLG1_9VIBR|nr:phosphoglycolate phosphatase [Vibrio sp. KJ40-1]MDB1122360.1 phosphoglycolate phosphatase [Vibrio sp. KJ40-1]